MTYISPFCPDDDQIITKNGKMKISKLYYKMNPRRDPYNKIIDVQNFFFTKCVSLNKEKNYDKKIQKQKSLKELRNFNEYDIRTSKTGNQISISPEDIPFYYNDSSNIFQTSIKINDKTNNKNSNSNLNNKEHVQNIDNSKVNPNVGPYFNNNAIKSKILNKSKSYIIKLDKIYYKIPTLNKQIYILNNRNRREFKKRRHLFRLSDDSGVLFDDSDMSKYDKIIPLSRQNYLNEQFFFDNNKKNILSYLKRYQIKEIQNRRKIKPFIY